MIRYCVVILILLQFAFVTADSSAASNDKLVVRFDGKRMSVHAYDTPLESIIKLIQLKTGIRFIYHPSTVRGKTNVHFDEIPLMEALSNVISPLNHAMIRDPKENELKVLILSGEGGAPSPDEYDADHGKANEGGQPSGKALQGFFDDYFPQSGSISMFAEGPNQLDSQESEDGPPQTIQDLTDGPPTDSQDDSSGPPSHTMF